MPFSLPRFSHRGDFYTLNSSLTLSPTSKAGTAPPPFPQEGGQTKTIRREPDRAVRLGHPPTSTLDYYNGILCLLVGRSVLQSTSNHFKIVQISSFWTSWYEIPPYKQFPVSGRNEKLVGSQVEKGFWTNIRSLCRRTHVLSDFTIIVRLPKRPIILFIGTKEQKPGIAVTVEIPTVEAVTMLLCSYVLLWENTKTYLITCSLFCLIHIWII